MIKLKHKGTYRLVETRDRKKLLYLDDQGYIWSHAKGIGELLLFSKHTHETQYILAQGVYRLYAVKDEPEYIDLEHLELSLGKNSWQGYLLLTGLPTSKKIRSRVVPTDEVIRDRRITTKK